jgi:hypothetical protein
MMVRYRRREAAYLKIKTYVEEYMWKVLQQRVLGKQSLAVHSDTGDDVTTYTEVPAAKIADLLTGNTIVTQL